MIYFTKYCLLANRCPPRSSKIAYETGCKYITQLNIDPFTSTTMCPIKKRSEKNELQKKNEFWLFSQGFWTKKYFHCLSFSGNLSHLPTPIPHLRKDLPPTCSRIMPFNVSRMDDSSSNNLQKSPEKTQSDRIHGDIYLHFLDFYGEGRKIYDTID